MIWVADARTLPDYRMWVRFSDATEGVIDLKDIIAPERQDSAKGAGRSVGPAVRRVLRRLAGVD